MASPTVAANAYASLARIMESAGGAAKGSETGGQSFGALLKDAVGSVLESGRKSDAQTVAMASGKANVMIASRATSSTSGPVIASPDGLAEVCRLACFDASRPVKCSGDQIGIFMMSS